MLLRTLFSCAFICFFSFSFAQIGKNPSNQGNNSNNGLPKNPDNIVSQDSAQTNKSNNLRDRIKEEDNTYGFHTTSYFLFRDLFEPTDTIKNGLPAFRNLLSDTIPTLFHRYQPLQAFDYQDLATVGTAARSLVLPVEQTLGTRLGINTYAPYLEQIQQMRFYDALAPFSYIRYAQGGAGRARLDAVFTRNIDPNNSFTLSLNHHSALLLRGQNRVGAQERAAAFKLFSFNFVHKSKTQRWLSVAQFHLFENKIKESGGLLYQKDTLNKLTDLFDTRAENFSNRLNGVSNNQSGNQIRWLNRYALTQNQALSIFHQLEKITRKYEYFSATPKADTTIYKQNFFPDATTSYHSIWFQSLENQVGVQGNTRKIAYRIYLKNKQFKYSYSLTEQNQFPVALTNQQFFGAQGKISLLKNKLALAGHYEQMIGNDLFYSVDANIWGLYGQIIGSNYSPSLLENKYIGQHFRWENQFQNTLHNSLVAGYKINKKQSIDLSFRLDDIRNFVYFDTSAVPVQANQALNLLYLQAFSSLTFGRISSDLKLRFAQVLAGQAYFTTPALSFQTAIWYNFDVKNVLKLQTGIDFLYMSEFSGYDYMPATQQYFLQNKYQTHGYPVLDIFLNAKMKRTLFFAKICNILNGIRGGGYFLTPGYMAQPRQLEFGLNWMLFN